MYDVNDESKTLTANMNDKKDIEAARKEFLNNNDLEKIVVKNENKIAAISSGADVIIDLVGFAAPQGHLQVLD